MGWRAMNFGDIVGRPEVLRTGSHRSSGGPRKSRRVVIRDIENGKQKIENRKEKNKNRRPTLCAKPLQRMGHPQELEIGVNRKGGPPPSLALCLTAGKQK